MSDNVVSLFEGPDSRADERSRSNFKALVFAAIGFLVVYAVATDGYGLLEADVPTEPITSEAPVNIDTPPTPDEDEIVEMYKDARSGEIGR